MSLGVPGTFRLRIGSTYGEVCFFFNACNIGDQKYHDLKYIVSNSSCFKNILRKLYHMDIHKLYALELEHEGICHIFL
jgi:hypothetical protein